MSRQALALGCRDTDLGVAAGQVGWVMSGPGTRLMRNDREPVSVTMSSSAASARAITRSNAVSAHSVRTIASRVCATWA